MPNVKPGESRKDFVGRCIPVVLEDGTAKDQDQAVAICSEMWRDRAKMLAMKVTKVQRLDNGRTRWQARANTGEFDLLQERFDQAFFGDVVKNFYRVKEALSRGDPPPGGMSEPILDISHYSIYLPADKRNLARAGWIDKMWRDGRALFAQGFFDDSRLGHLAEKAALERKPEERRVSIVVYPDYSAVDVETGGRKIYRGGSGLAYLDSLAMTSAPADPGALMEVKAVDISKDAQIVLGKEGDEVVAELEAARTAKTVQTGAVIKTDDENEVNTDEAAQPLTADDLAAALGAIMPQLGKAIDARVAPLADQVAGLTSQNEELKSQVKALGATEAEKVQKAINDKSFFEKMWPDEQELSVQRSASGVPAKGKVKSPEETKPYKDGEVGKAWGVTG